MAGGKGAPTAARDERLIAWLRRVRRNTGMIRPIAEGRALLRGGLRVRTKALIRKTGTAAGSSRLARGQLNGRRCGRPARIDAKRAGDDQTRPRRRDRAHGGRTLLADSCSNLAPLLGEDGGLSPGDKVRAAARWLQENCQQPISIADAAQFAAMSERNFLRRFKMEMGITPSSFLLHERLAVTCSLLTESELPVDKIARRTGMGNGDRLAKVFRKRMRISPTEFRIQSRRVVGE